MVNQQLTANRIRYKLVPHKMNSAIWPRYLHPCMPNQTYQYTRGCGSALDGVGRCNSSSWKTQTLLSITLNTISPGFRQSRYWSSYTKHSGITTYKSSAEESRQVKGKSEYWSKWYLEITDIQQTMGQFLSWTKKATGWLIWVYYKMISCDTQNQVCSKYSHTECSNQVSGK